MEQAKLLYLFAVVIRSGSLSAAAKVLHITPSAVSQHLNRLEDIFKLKLLNRSTRRLELTEAGCTLLPHAEQVYQAQSLADDAMNNLLAEPSGKVRISISYALMNTAEMRAAVANIRQRYPKITLDLLINDDISDIQKGEVDIAVRAGEQHDTENNIIRRLAEWNLYIAAHPDYLARHPVKQPDDAYRAAWINHNDGILKSVFTHLGLLTELPPNLINCRASTAGALELAKMAQGLTLMLAKTPDGIAEHGLQVVLENHPLPPRKLYSVIPHRRQSAKNQAVLGVLKEVFG